MPKKVQEMGFFYLMNFSVLPSLELSQKRNVGIKKRPKIAKNS
jgi:hypothetical protein